MKGFGFFLVLASLLDGCTYFVESSFVNQRLALVHSKLKSIAENLPKQELSKEPFVAYSKLETGTLEVFGTAFVTNVTAENVEFLQKLTNAFRIESVVFKWFYFDAKMLKILDVFDQKLQNSVKSVTFEQCYFPEALFLDSPLELKRVTNCSFIDCFADEKALKKIFKIFKIASVSSLALSNVLDYAQREPIVSNVDLKKFSFSNDQRREVKIDNLELNFFSKLEFLSLSNCLFDLRDFNLTALTNLKIVDISCTSFENNVSLMNLNAFPCSLQRIKIKNPGYYNNLDLIANVVGRKVIIDNTERIDYSEMGCVEYLSVFSSLSFGTNSMKNEMNNIMKCVEQKGGILKEVKEIRFDIDFNRQDIANMMQLLAYFPNLESIQVVFNGECEASQNCDEIRKLFSALNIKNIQKLWVFFHQSGETPEFYCFVVELMKLCQNMSTLQFNYPGSNSFADSIKNQISENEIKFPNLNSFIVKYSYWDSINILIDLFYPANYSIKDLTILISNDKSNSEIELVPRIDLDSLKALANFQVESLNFSVPSIFFSEDEIVEKILTKLPSLSNFTCDYFPNFFYSPAAIGYLQNLKTVSIDATYHKHGFINLLKVLPSTFESLGIRCNIEDMEEFESLFYQKFPRASLSLTSNDCNSNVEKPCIL